MEAKGKGGDILCFHRVALFSEKRYNLIKFKTKVVNLVASRSKFQALVHYGDILCSALSFIQK